MSKGRQSIAAVINVSEAVTALIVDAIFMPVFDFKNQVIFSKTFFDGANPRVPVDTCVLEYQKAVVFHYDAFGGRISVIRLTLRVLNIVFLVWSITVRLTSLFSFSQKGVVGKAAVVKCVVKPSKKRHIEK